MKPSFKRGFTLVELLVVVLIIGILSSVALPQYTKAVNKAKGTKVLTTGDALVKALNLAYLEDGCYKRVYRTYSGDPTPEKDDFDIDIPRVQVNSSYDVSIDAGYKCSSGSCCYDSADVYLSYYSPSNEDFVIRYHLSAGKLSYITCNGNLCSSYFPSSILSSN